MEDYRLEQTGQEVQGILNGAAMQTELAAETERATAAEQQLQGNIDAEELARQQADAALEQYVDGKVSDEELARQQADTALQGNIEAEETRAKAAEQANATDIETINGKIPAEASAENKLVDNAALQGTYYTKDAVDNLIQGLGQNDVIVGALPTTGEANKIYRVPGDGEYSDYMWFDGVWKLLATYSANIQGYQYIGIATPTTNPGTPSNNVFYFAHEAGTYTNFGALVVTQGINILKYDGTAWTLEQLAGIDDVPTAGSEKLVKSGGVYDKTFGYSKVNYSEAHTSTYLNTKGKEVEGGSGKVIVYNILPNNEYYLDAVLYKANSSTLLVGVAIYATDENNDIPILLLKRVSANAEHYSIKINTAGISDVAKLKVAVTGTSSPILNVKCTDSHYWRALASTISPISIDYGKAIRTNGNIEDQSSNIYSFPVSPNKVYIVYASPLAFTSSYVFIILCDGNGTVVKTVSKFNPTNYPKSKWCINTAELSVATLKIVSSALPLVSEYENADYTQLADIDGNIEFDRINGTLPLNKMENIPLEKIEQTAILSTNGYYNVITEDSEDANSAIKYSDGSIITDSQYMKAGVVRHYTLPDNVVVKIHFITPAFSSVYIAGCVLKNGTVVKKYLRLNSTNETVDFVIDNRTLKADTMLLSINKNSKDYTIVTHTAEILEPASGGLPSASALVEMPTKIYTLEQTAMKFGVIQRLYIEGLANSSNKTLKIDGAQNVVIDYGKQYTSHNQTYTQYINISADGYSDYSAGVSVRETEPTKLNNQRPKILCIGDSLTDNGYPALVEFIAKSLNQDYNNTIGVTMVGTKLENLDISLGEYSFNGCRGCNEGRSGWAICTYLRHINVVTANKTQWDILGLGTMTRNGVPSRSYVSFDSTNQEHLALLSSTCHGWYDVENTEEVFNYLTNSDNYHIHTFVYDGETYTLGDSYSSDQYSVMVKAFKYILTGGEWVPNPFYSYDTVQTSNGDYAFNFSEYINKYKTLDVDGVTRLVAGSTAGTNVTNVTYYDVCVPSHVVIIMSENYQRYGSNITAADIVDDFESIADLIYQYNSSVKIAIGCTRKYGAFNPSMYEFYPGVFSFNSYLYNIWKEVKTRFTNGSYYIIPLYATQSILGSGGGRSFDSLDQKERCKMIGDYTHTGDTVTSYLDRAIGVISWVASTY